METPLTHVLHQERVEMRQSLPEHNEISPDAAVTRKIFFPSKHRSEKEENFFWNIFVATYRMQIQKIISINILDRILPLCYLFQVISIDRFTRNQSVPKMWYKPLIWLCHQAFCDCWLQLLVIGQKYYFREQKSVTEEQKNVNVKFSQFLSITPVEKSKATNILAVRRQVVEVTCTRIQILTKINKIYISFWQVNTPHCSRSI